MPTRFATGFAAGVLLAAAPMAAGDVAVGQAAPAFTVTTVDGRKMTPQDWRGKRVLVFMWASW